MFIYFDEIPYVFLAAKKGADEPMAQPEAVAEDTEDTSVIMCAKNLVMLSSSTPDPLVRKCQVCMTTRTPLWRRWAEYHTLCNACGIRERATSIKRARCTKSH